MLARTDRAHPKRFCSEPCRKRAERSRAYQRSHGDDDAVPIGAVLAGNVSRLLAEAPIAERRAAR